MAIKFTLEHGGYVLADGDIQIVGYDTDDPGVKHAERGRCPKDHDHSKVCAVELLDFRPIVTPAGKDEDDEPIAEVLGPSIRTRIEEWFKGYNATPDDPVHVEMPKKTVKAKNDKGKVVDKEVEDRDL